MDGGVDIGVALNNLAKTLNIEGGSKNLKEAEKVAKRSIQIKRKSPICGPNHPSTASSLTTLSEIYGRLGKHQKAAKHLQEAIDILERVHGKKHPKVAEALCSLANVLDDLEGDGVSGHSEKAMVIRERCVIIGDRW